MRINTSIISCKRMGQGKGQQGGKTSQFVGQLMAQDCNKSSVAIMEMKLKWEGGYLSAADASG